MRAFFTTLALVGLSSFVFVGCEKKNEGSEGTSSSPSQGPAGEEGKDSGKVSIDTDPNKKLLESLELTELLVPEMLPPVAANTPGSLAIIVGNPLTSFDIECGNTGTSCASGPDQQVCMLLEDIKCRFFASSGPVAIKQILDSLDRDMSEIEAMSSGKYIPCLDPVGNKDGLEVQDGDQKKTYLPFEDVKLDTKFTGLKDKDGNEQELDLGYKFSLSCMRFLDNEKTNWSAFGVKKNEDSKKLYTVSTMGNKDGERNGSVGTIDEDDNVVYWGIVSQTGKESVVALDRSNALIYLKSNAAAQTIELNFTGRNVGPGCGTRMITNKTYALIETNMNMDTDCDANSGNLNNYCIKVDGKDPALLPDLVDCETAGLTTASFTRDRLTRSMIEPNEIYKLFPAPQGVPDFSFFDLPKKEDKPAATE